MLYLITRSIFALSYFFLTEEIKLTYLICLAS